MKIIVICGSPRQESLTRRLTDIAFRCAKERYPEAEVDYLDLGRVAVNPFRGYEEDYDRVTQQAVERVTSADVLIIGAPIYNGLINAALKNLFEHISHKALEGRVAGFIVQSGGTISSLQVQGQLIALMTYFRVLSNPRAVFASRDQHFDEQGNLADQGVGERIQRLVEETVGLATGESTAE